MQVTTPLLFKLIPAVVHLGVLLRWFSPDSAVEVITCHLVDSLWLILWFRHSEALLGIFLSKHRLDIR
jgi:hypothetical protein